ncbi:MAG: phosphoribosyl-AMP cyclohydrolase [Methylococcales bacterium]|nr:phosphoribosyl-AMP cyclohydrolase [Methylococcales bacterium]
MNNTTWLDEICWTEDGLVPVIAQQTGTGRVVMFAWMNRESLALTVEKGYAVYWSRSRNRLWRKGEKSGNTQKIISIQLDCDEDVILLEIEQQGGIACHTGRESCFYRTLIGEQWQTTEMVLKNPKDIYTK